MARDLESIMSESIKNMDDLMKKSYLDSQKQMIEHCDIPDEINQEQINSLNELLGYYAAFKQMVMDWARLEDERHQELSKKLDRLQSKLANIEDMERCNLPRKKCC